MSPPYDPGEHLGKAIAVNDEYRDTLTNALFNPQPYLATITEVNSIFTIRQ
ncbi:MAG: hypothetical protein HQ478_02225 [Chloroflexi bacterium]|nr:hypothetical protein [Chloroflexota bacterium]